MPTLTEGSRAASGPLAMSVSLDDMEEGRRSPTNLLIDTMELVEARKPMHVPNHLLETSGLCFPLEIDYISVTKAS